MGLQRCRSTDLNRFIREKNIEIGQFFWACAEEVAAYYHFLYLLNSYFIFLIVIAKIYLLLLGHRVLYPVSVNITSKWDATRAGVSLRVEYFFMFTQ